MVRRRLVSLTACALLVIVAWAGGGPGQVRASTITGRLLLETSEGGPAGTVLNAVAGLGDVTRFVTGTADFELYGPDDPSCAGAPAYSQVSVMSDGVARTTPGFTATKLGTYSWTVSYSGDATYPPAAIACGEAAWFSGAAMIAPALPTRATNGAMNHEPTHAWGTALNDTATPAGGDATGTVEFNLYSAGDPNCSGDPVYSQTVTLVNGTATTSPGYTATDSTIGYGGGDVSYRWTASYSGDATHPAALSQCGDGYSHVDELNLVQFYGSAANTAHVRPTFWGVTPDAGGTVTYTVYSFPTPVPWPPSCTTGGQDAGTVAVVNGNAGASNDIAIPAGGVLYWSASYSGDANNHAVVSECPWPQWAPAGGGWSEGLPTSASPGGPAGTVIHETASPLDTDGTGSVQIMLFGPGDPTCLFAIQWVTVPLVNGTATSPGFAASVPGTYRWSAFYDGGDQQAGVNDGASTYQCTDATVITAGPPGATAMGSDVPVATTPAGSTAALNVVFGQVDTSGQTSATVSTSGPAPAGFNVGGSPAYYDITTTATYSGTITICVPYNPISYADPSKVRLYHYDNGAWIDITSSVSAAAKTVCGTTSSLSPFVVGQPIQQSQSITFGPMSNQTYGAAPLTLTATSSSGLQVAYSASGPCSISGATLTITGAGACTVTASQPGDSSWPAATPVSQSFTIGQAPLTVTAPSPKLAYGTVIPALVPTYSGFVAGDTATSLTTAPVCTPTATNHSPVGMYPVTCSGAVDPNYSISYVGGSLGVVVVDRFVTPANTALTVPVPGVFALTNGSLSSVTISKAPQGKLVLQPSGAFTYTPKTGFTGADSFTYKATINGVAGPATTVTVYVLGTGTNCTSCNLSGLVVGSRALTGSNLSKANLASVVAGGSNLTGANLSSATLSYATLSGSNLTGANVSGANATNADLSKANATGANFSSSNLSGASLAGSNLTGANLSSVNLTGANLAGATTTGANLRGVTWSNTTCPDGANSSSHGNTCSGHLTVKTSRAAVGQIGMVGGDSSRMSAARADLQLDWLLWLTPS